MTDFPDWTAPQAHATAISTTGAPSLVFKRLIDVLIGQSIAAASSITRPASGQFALNQPGYEIQLNVGTLGGTAPIVSVELQWFDSSFGARMDDEIYYFYSGNVNGHQIHGRGPTKGDQVVVIIHNYSATSAVTVSYTLLQTSRVFTREFWKTIGPNATAPVFPGFTAATMNPSSGALAVSTGSVAANGNTSLVLPLYTGTVAFTGLTTDTTAGNSEWDIVTATDQQVPQATVLAGRNGESGFAADGATSLYLPDVSLPRSQCTLNMLNHNATTTESLTGTMFAREDRS